MISFLLYANQKEELTLLKENSFDVICRISEDDWDILEYYDKKQVFEYLEKNPVIDVSCVDVTSECGIEIAEDSRRRNGNMFMVLLSDNTVSPNTYIRPSIMASSLLLRPISEETIKEVFFEVLSAYLKKYRQADNQQDSFVIDAREGRELVPLNRICFFEARDKKIYIYTDHKEYSCYDTLDKIEEGLEKEFVRCHRSFIVARSMIKKIIFSQNMIELCNGITVPISRTYKKFLKEIK